MGKRKCKLEIGKFYHAYGGKPHPAQIYKKTSHGTYVSVKTGTTNGPDMIPIKPTQKGILQSAPGIDTNKKCRRAAKAP